MDKLDLKTPDGVSENIERIAELFPDCVTETADGKTVDFDLLKQELSRDIVEGPKERYRLEWPGKREAIVMANTPTTNTLRPVCEDSVNFDSTENLYIEGDNLEVLKLLQESYLGKIKMIYIDPPYNTGNDFVYRDNFAQDADEFKTESGLTDEMGNRLVPNPETAGRYHSDWLTMMYPRLKLARNLLTDDGVIFISIDDHEVHNLRKICDEIFGEVSIVAQIPWQSRQSIQNDTDFSVNHEYIISYAKRRRLENRRLKETNYTEWHKKNDFVCHPLPLEKDKFDNPDQDSRGLWKADPFDAPHIRPNLTYVIKNPNTGAEYLPPRGRCWRTEEKKFLEFLEDNRILFGKTGDSRPQLKVFYEEKKEFGSVDNTWFSGDRVGTATKGTKELQSIFNGVAYFDTPKPETLIRKLILLSGASSNDIILDFFSGSATTAHAVMRLNAEDGGHRKFIMVQVPEKTDEKSEAYKAGYKTICEIGKERIRRAAKKISQDLEEKKQEDSDNLFNQDKPQYNDIDLGFRVYRLDTSNMQDVYYRPQDYRQDQISELFENHIKSDRTADDLVAQVMLAWGLPLSLPIKHTSISGKTVYKIAGNSLYCCFDEQIDESFARAVAKEAPLRIVFHDYAFADDTAKENVRQLLKQLCPDTEMKVI